MDNSVEFYDISKITRFIKDQRQISLSDAHKIIRQFIDGKIDYKYGYRLCMRNVYTLDKNLGSINEFFNKIDFNTRGKVDEEQFFLDMLDFMHSLMFNLAFISDTNKKANFNLFFMYRKREMKIAADINPFDFYKSIEYGEVISEHPGGCFYKILREIPPKYLKDDKFKQKLKRIADDSLKVLDRADRAHYGRIVPYLSLKIYLYANYDLGSNSDKQNLFDELRSEINAIKYGERIGSWPKKIFFEKQTLYDIAKIFAETKKSNGLDDYCKERNRVLANVLICFQTKDLKEEDFDKLCKIMNQCGTNRFVFERDGSGKDFLPYYVFLPWLKENLFNCKGSVGESKAIFLFEETYVQILASSNFAFDNSTVECILQSLQKLFEQKQLIITDDRKSTFYRFTLYLLNSSFESIDTYLLYQQYESMIKKYLNVDDKYLTDNKERRLVMLKSYLDDYAKKFFLEGRAKMLRRQTERCDTKVISELIKKDISEPTKVSELKTVALDKLKEIISYINNNRQFSNWVTNNVMETKERGEYRMDDRNNFDSFLSEDFINNNRQFSNWVTNNVMETKELGQYWMDDRDNFDSFLSEDFIFIEYLDIKKFFDAINFSEYQFETLENEKGFFKDVLDFMRRLMFNIFSVNDSEVGIYFQKRGVNFNSFFMYCSRECPKSYDKKDKRCGMYDKFLNNEPSGYLAKILGAIPKELLADKVIKQKIKEIADDSLKAFDELDAEKCGLIFPYLFLKIYLYKKYDLAASNQDKQILFNELKEELNSIKNGLRKSNWPRNIIFEKQILYDISEYFEDAVDKKEIADVVRSAIIYCHVQDFSEQDFKWYSDNFETDVKNKTEIKVDRDGQPLKNLFLDETDSKIGYYKLKFIVDSNFIIFDKSRLNDEKFKPFSSEEFDIILKKISNEIKFINQDVQDGIFCVFLQMLKDITKNKFSDTVKILFDIIDTSTTVAGVFSYIYTVKAVEYIDYLYDKYMCKEGKYRPDLKGCLREIHDESRSEYRKYKEELEKKRKEDLEKKRIETEKKKKQRKKQESEKIKHNGDSISDSEEESKSNEEKKEKKKNKRKDIKEKEKNKKKTNKHKRRKEESSSDLEEENESDNESDEVKKKNKHKNIKENIKEKEKNQTKKNKHRKKYNNEGNNSYSEEENESEKESKSQSSEGKDNKKKKKKYKSNVKRKNNHELDSSSDEEDNDEKEKNKKKKHKHHKEESSSDSEEESKSNEKEKGKKKNKLKNIKEKEKFDENTKKKSYKKKINKHKHRKKENKSESENESEEKIKKKKIRQTKSKEENKSDKERIETEKKIVQDKKIIKTEILVKDEESKLNPKKENGSIEKGESDKTNKKNYPNDINKNGEVLSQLNKNENESIDQSCNYKSKPNTEQVNSLNTNNDNSINIQIKKPRISNENTYDQTDEEKKEIKEKQQRKEESKPNSEEKSEITKKKAENKEIDKNKQRKKESNSYLKEENESDTEILTKGKGINTNPKQENESIEKSESSNTDKKDYSGSIKYNGVALGSQNKNNNDNEIIARSCDDKIKINTEQVNSLNTNNDNSINIQINKPRILNKNAYDQTKENPPSSQDNKNKKLKLIFGIIGTVLFILAFILFFTLALSLAVKIIISLAILIFSMVCFVIVYKIRKLEPPQNLNNGNIVYSEQSFLNDRQEKNEKSKNRVSDKIDQENKTEYGNLVETK